eukprot:4355638-Ditylum_brightwellii.AAC.1
MKGIPPPIRTNGAESIAALPEPSETFATDSRSEVFFANNAALFAFPTAISYDAANALLHRLARTGTPPASLMQIVTSHPLALASASAPAIASSAPLAVIRIVGASKSTAGDGGSSDEAEDMRGRGLYVAICHSIGMNTAHEIASEVCWSVATSSAKYTLMRLDTNPQVSKQHSPFRAS